MTKTPAHYCASSFFLFGSMLVISLSTSGQCNNSSLEIKGRLKAPLEIQWCGSSTSLHYLNLNTSENNQTGKDARIFWSFPQSIVAEGSDSSSGFVALLKPKKLNCDERNRKEITIVLNTSRRPGNFPNEFLANGYFRANDVDYYHPREYCISNISSEEVSVQICEAPECGGGSPCIPVCCPLGKLFSPGQKRDNSSGPVITCLDAYKGSSPFSPVLYKDPGVKAISHGLAVHFQRRRITALKCANDTPPLLMAFIKNEAAIQMYGVLGLCYRIRYDGTLLYRNSHSEWGEVASDQYCLQGFQQYSSNLPFGSKEDEFGGFFCSPPPSHPVVLHTVFYGSMMIVASIFLLLTLLVYILLWNQQNIHGWTTMGHAASMLCMYLCLGTVSLLDSTYGYDKNHTIGCKIFGIITHFFFLSTFCWLTLINFDLFWTFRCMSPRSQRSKGHGRFALYTIFGWGLPLGFVAISVVLDELYGSGSCSTFLTPEYGVLNCYVAAPALGRYVYYPIAGLWSVNLVFFACTTYKLTVYKKSTQIAMENMSERQQLFKLCMKLFFVMGCTWIFEFLSWFHAGTDIKWYWAIFDLINLLQAMAIFIIFVCKEDILRSLQNQCPMLKPILRPIHMCLTCRNSVCEPEPCTSYTNTTAGTGDSGKLPGNSK